MGRGCIAVIVPPHPHLLSLSSCGASARAGARTQPLQATTSQIWRDEAHVATDKPLWSISWMHSESVERKALKIKPCPDVPSNDYVVSGAKGNQQTSRNLEQRACQFSTLIKHTQVAQWYDANRAKADILWCLISWKSQLPMKLVYY